MHTSSKAGLDRLPRWVRRMCTIHMAILVGFVAMELRPYAHTSALHPS